jgi:hypothetical protein
MWVQLWQSLQRVRCFQTGASIGGIPGEGAGSKGLRPSPPLIIESLFIPLVYHAAG